MKAVKILGRFLAVLLAIIFGFVLLVLILVAFSKDIIEQDSIDKYIVGAEIVNTKSQEFFYGDSSHNKTIEQQICKDLSLIGISNVSTQNVLESKNMDKVLSDYVANYVNYILFNENKPELSDYLVASIFEEELVNSGNVLSLKQKEQLESYIHDLTNKINGSVPTINDLENMGYDIDTLRLVSGNIFSVSSIILIGILLLVIYIFIALCLWSKLRAIRWISVPTLLVGLTFIALCFLEVKLLNLFVNNQGIIDGLILNIVNKSFQSLFIYGLSLMGIGIALVIISSVMIKNSKKKAKMKPIEIGNEEKSSSFKENLKNYIVASEEDMDKIDDTVVTTKKEVQDIEDIVDEAKEGVTEETKSLDESKDIVKEIENSNKFNALVVKDKEPVDLVVKDDKTNDLMVNQEDSVEEPKIKEELINDVSIPEKEYNEKIKVQQGKEIPDVEFVDGDIEIEDPKASEKTYDYSKDDFDIDIVEIEKDIVPIKDELELDKTSDKETKVIEMEKIDDIEINQDYVKDDSKYVEIDDEEEEIVKKDKDVKFPENICIDVVSPIKGKDIIPVTLDKEEEEEIEIL